MEFQQVLQKRIKGMAVRILANIEHTVGADLGDMRDDEQFTLNGADFNIIRNEILNAAGDTTRSLRSLLESAKPGHLAFDREMITALNNAQLEIHEDRPVFIASGIFNSLNKIRGQVKAGIVYNNMYYCVGLEDTVKSLIPFLDTVRLTGIKIAQGQYEEWRDIVSEIYLER